MASSSRTNAQTPYQILGVSPKSPMSAVEVARRNLLTMFHPSNYSTESDKLGAEKMSRRVEIAYDAIVAQRPYEILGVSPNSPMSAINIAKRTLQRKMHPDKNIPGSVEQVEANQSFYQSYRFVDESEALELERMFKLVEDSYARIITERNKQSGEKNTKRFNFNGDDAMAIFSKEFGAGDELAQRMSLENRPKDTTITLRLTRAELKSGVTRVEKGERWIRPRNGGGDTFKESYEIEIVIPPGLHYGDRIRFVNYGEQTEFHSADVVYVIKEYIG